MFKEKVPPLDATQVAARECWLYHLMLPLTYFILKQVWEIFYYANCLSIQDFSLHDFISKAELRKEKLILPITLFEKSNFCPKIQFWQNPNIFTSFSPNFFFDNFSREIKVVNS